MIEIAEHDEDASALLAESVFNGYAHVVESDVRGARRTRVARLDGLSLDARSTLDQNDCKAVLRLAADGKVISERPVGDPFFGA